MMNFIDLLRPLLVSTGSVPHLLTEMLKAAAGQLRDQHQVTSIFLALQRFSGKANT
jgi:hypothetical protein